MLSFNDADDNQKYWNHKFMSDWRQRILKINLRLHNWQHSDTYHEGFALLLIRFFSFKYDILSCDWKHSLLFSPFYFGSCLIYLNLISDPLIQLNIFFCSWLMATQQLATLSLCCSFRKRKVISNPHELGLDSLFYFFFMQVIKHFKMKIQSLLYLYVTDEWLFFI